ncbi:hydrogenase maturation protease [Candidatus Bathyarchaeota archaeon]|nr:hydrogenase maturation protease [Candidatus Bathyarchaeota archaeon]
MDFNSFKGELERRLDGTRKLAIIGIGADLREDDAVGNYLARALVNDVQEMARDMEVTITYAPGEELAGSNLLILNASVVPEQYITTVMEFNPDTMIIVDAAQMGDEALPGDLAFIAEDEIDMVTGSTHTLSLNHFTGILKKLGSTARVVIIGVHPARLDYGEDLSAPVNSTLTFLKDFLIEQIKKLNLMDDSHA